MKKKLLLVSILYSTISLQSIALATDITINSEVSNQDLTGDNNVTIGSGGDISSSIVDSPALRSSDKLNVTINAGVGQGIRNTAGGNAISSIGTTNIILKSGIITTNTSGSSLSADSSTIRLFQRSGDSSITVQSGTTLSNDKLSAGASAIFYTHFGIFPFVNNSSLTINNAGTIVSKSSNTGVIAVEDDHAGSVVTINNTGTIQSTASDGYSIFAGSGVVEVNNSGFILGRISLGTNSTSFININNDGGVIFGSLFFGNNGQKLDIKNGGTFSGGINGEGIVAIGSGSSLALSNLSEGNVKLLASINGANPGEGSLVINSDQSIRTRTNIGSINALESITLKSNSILNTAINNNSISATNVNITNNSTLIAGGNINANIIALSGTLDLRNSVGNTIFGTINGLGTGTLTLNGGNHAVNGNINLASGDTISTNIVDVTNAGKISATGAANVVDGVKLKVSLPSNILNVGDQYTIISSSAGSSISQIANSNINVAGNNTNRVGILEFTTVSLNNELILQVKRLSDSDVDQISIDSSQPNSAESILGNANNSLNISSARLGGLRGLASGEGIQNKTVWGQTFANNVRQGNTSKTDGYRAGSMGLIFGADHKFDNDITTGLSVSYSNSDIKSQNNLKKINVDSYQFNLYGSYDFGNYFVNSLAGIALNKYSSDRRLSNAVAQADYSGNTYIARVESGYNYKLMNNFVLTPTLGLTAARNEVDNYSETGAGLSNLNVKNNAVNFFETRLGLELGKEIIISKENRIRPKILTSYGYDFADDKQTTTMNFIGQSASFSSSSNISRESIRIGTGIEIAHLNSLKFNLDYGFEAKNSYQAHTGSLKARYSF